MRSVKHSSEIINNNVSYLMLLAAVSVCRFTLLHMFTFHCSVCKFCTNNLACVSLCQYNNSNSIFQLRNNYCMVCFAVIFTYFSTQNDCNEWQINVCRYAMIIYILYNKTYFNLGFDSDCIYYLIALIR